MFLSHEGYRTIKACRVCHHPDLISLFGLGDQYVSNFVDKDSPPGIKCPIELVLCPSCTLVQQRHTAPQDFLYSRHYWYRSGVTETMRLALRDITQKIEQAVQLESGDVVLDIGSNDGTLLRSYKDPNLIRVGVEPAENLAEEGIRGINYLINDFWDLAQYREAIGKDAKVITAIGMFYDLDDPNQFIADVAGALHPEGVFVAQLMCLKNMLDICDLGNLCHEHLEFYSLKSLVFLFGKYGLEIYNVDINSTNGRSYRLWVRHKGSGVGATLSNYWMQRVFDSEGGLDRPAVFQEFFSKMERNKETVVEFIEDARKRGLATWVYGASTKGNVILQYYGLDHGVIGGAADRSPEKHGKYTVGTNIPIYSEEYAREQNPSYFLVLPYSFLNEFVHREEAWRKRGGKFLVPLPSFREV